MDQVAAWPLAIRDADPGDISYVVDSWVRTFENAPRVLDHVELGGLTRDRYLDVMRAHVRRLLVEREPDILVAISADEPDRIAGWAAIEGDTLHYAVVRQERRGQGVLRRLLEGRQIRHFTHRSRFVIPKRVPDGIAFRPMRIEQEQT